MTDQLDIHGNAQPLTWDGQPLYSPETVAEGLFDPEAFEQMPGQLDIEEPAERIAERVTIHEAKRCFEDGGTVLVSEFGHETRRYVYPGMTLHTRKSTTWDDLVSEVREWRHRYPNQRFYIVRDAS